MVTVANLLENLKPYNIKLLTGENGIHENINYISIQESPLKSKRIYERGLIMSTLQLFKDVPEIINHMKWLISVEVKAFCIHLAIIKKVPQEVIDFSHKNNLPLLIIPENVPYSDIYDVFFKLLQEDSNAKRLEIEKINSSLLKSVASGKGPAFILNLMSQQLSATIIYLDKHVQIDNIQTTNQYKKESIEKAIKNIIYKDKLFIKKHLSEDISVRYMININGDTKTPFNLFPITNDNEYFGSILVEVKSFSSLLTKPIIFHGKTALLLDLARKNTLEKYLRNDDIKYLEVLFKSESNNTKKDYYKLSPLLKDENIIYLFVLDNFKDINDAYDFLYKEKNSNSLIWIHNQEIVLITDTVLSKSIFNYLEQWFANIIVGVSEKKLTQSADDITKKYNQAKVAIERGIKRGITINKWREMRFDRILFISTQSQLLVDESLEVLSPLIKHDKKFNTEYVSTLEIYLDNFFSLKKTASELFVHRNTVWNRIKKIESLYPEINLKDSEVYLVFSNSIKLYNLGYIESNSSK